MHFIQLIQRPQKKITVLDNASGKMTDFRQKSVGVVPLSWFRILRPTKRLVK